MVEGHTLLLDLIAKTMTAETLTPEEMTDILYSPEYDDISKVVLEKRQYLSAGKNEQLYI